MSRLWIAERPPLWGCYKKQKHIPQRVMVALQNRPSCLLHKKTLNYRQRPNLWGPGGAAGTRANSRVEYLFCLSFSLPLCHPQAWRALARVILGRDEHETESKHMKHEGNVKHILAKQKKPPQSTDKDQICSPGEIKAMPALHFRGTCTKRVAGLKMSLLESGRISCCS